MKIIQSAAMGVCLFTAVSVHAQQTDSDTATKFTPPVIEKNADPASKSEAKKKQYKSKEWKQGDEVMTDTTKGGNEKSNLRMQRKAGKPMHGTPPPPPPPPAAPAVPPPPPGKK